MRNTINHLIRSEKTGLFDVVITSGAEVLAHTRQGYERRAGCYTWLRAIMRGMRTSEYSGIIVQDETRDKIQVYELTLKSCTRLKLFNAAKRYKSKKA